MHKRQSFFNWITLLSFTGFFLFSLTLVLTNSLENTISMGELGKKAIKLIQLGGVSGLSLLIISLGFTLSTSEFSNFQIISSFFKTTINSMVLFLIAISLGILELSKTNIRVLLVPFFTGHYPLLLGIVLFILLIPLLNRVSTQLSYCSIGIFLLAFMIISQVTLFFPDFPLGIKLILVMYPSFNYLIGVFLRKIPRERLKFLFSILLLGTLLISILFFISRTTVLPFHQESGLTFSANFIEKLLITPIPTLFSTLILILCLLSFKKTSTNLFLNTHVWADSLVVLCNPVSFIIIKSLFASLIILQTRFLILISVLIVICVLLVLFSFFLCLLTSCAEQDLYNKKPTSATIIYVGFLLIMSMNYILNLFMTSFDPKTTFSWYQRSFYLMLINLALLALIYIVCLVLFNRFWLGNTFFLALTLIYGFANYEKILYRNEPITPVDLSNYAALPEIINMIGIRVVLLLVSSLLLLFIGSILIQRKTSKKRLFRLPFRLLLLVIPILVLVHVSNVSANFKYGSKNTVIAQILNKANFVPHPESLLYNANRNGHLLAFASLTNVNPMREPAGYSEKNIKKLEKKYNLAAHELNKEREEKFNTETVVYILSESFSDPTKLPTLSLSSDPIPFTRSLMETNTSGEMFSMGYGGGTANIEFEALTSLSMDNFDPAMTTPYLFVVPKREKLFTINQLFSKSIAIHPYTASTYRRDKAFDKMKFDAFYYLGNDKYPIEFQSKKDNSKYISDESAFNETLKHIKDSTGDLFIQLTTMQNHMPYSSDTFKNTMTVNGDLSNKSKQQVETFSQGLNYSDKALKNFISKIDQMDQPVTIVFYGDHLPAIYDGGILSEKNIDTKLHLTDYFIYQNHSFKNLKKSIVTPNMFSPMMMATLNQKVSPYYALLTSVSESLPAMELQKIIDNQGNLISTDNLSKVQRQLLNDYRLIQYDITTGKDYLSDNFFKILK